MKIALYATLLTLLVQDHVLVGVEAILQVPAGRDLARTLVRVEVHVTVRFGQAELVRRVNDVDKVRVAVMQLLRDRSILVEWSSRVQARYSARLDAEPGEVGLVEDAAHVCAQAEADAVYVRLVDATRVKVGRDELGSAVHVLDGLPVVGDHATPARQLLPVHDYYAEARAFLALQHLVLHQIDPVPAYALFFNFANFKLSFFFLPKSAEKKFGKKIYF